MYNGILASLESLSAGIFSMWTVLCFAVVGSLFGWIVLWLDNFLAGQFWSIGKRDAPVT